MKGFIITILFFVHILHSDAQIDNHKEIDTRNNGLFVELAGRGYYSLNYERQWNNKNALNLGLGWNHMETYLTTQEAIDMNVKGDHEVSPYLLLYTQYSRLFGKKRSFLELGGGAVFTVFDMGRFRFAKDLYSTESYVALYPLVGYRFQGYNGFLFLFSFNPIIQIPQGYIWPIPGISFGYRF